MIAALSPKPQLVTRRLGDLAAIQNPNVQAVIWSRILPRDTVNDLPLPDSGSLAFVTLVTDPYDRVQHQLRKAGLHSHFLNCDVALLVSVYGELTRSSRVRVTVSRTDGLAPAGPREIRLVAAYRGRLSTRTRITEPARTSRFASYVGVFRGEWTQDHPLANPTNGLIVSLDSLPMTTPDQRPA